MDPYSLFVFLVGLGVGWLLTLVIRRCRALTYAATRSEGVSCPDCHTAMAAVDALAFGSWLPRGGRCRTCGMPIHAANALVILLAGLALVIAYARSGVSVAGLEVATLLLLLLAIATIDVQTFYIFDVFTVGGIVAGLVFTGWQFGWGAALRTGADALTAGMSLFAFGWCVSRLLRTEALGSGDAFLVAMLAAFLGFGGALVAVYYAALVGVAFTLVGWILRRRLASTALTTAAAPGSRIPFGLPLALGGVLVKLLGGTGYAVMLSHLLPWR